MKKDVSTYMKILGIEMFSKTWILINTMAGLASIIIWIWPKATIENSSNITWFQANSGWVALSIFLVVFLIVSPFLAWRKTYHETLDCKSKLSEYESEEGLLKREKLEREVRQQRDDQYTMDTGKLR